MRVTPAILFCVCAVTLSGAPSPLADAAQGGDLALVRSLIARKTDVNASQGDGMTALHWAAAHGDLPMTKALLAAKANVQATTRLRAMTPLFFASQAGNGPVVEALAAAGADVNAANETGITPLMMAAAAGSVEAVNLLVQHGANVNAKEQAREQTALMFAADKNRGAAIRALIAKGADANAATKVAAVERVRFEPDPGAMPPEQPPAPTVAPAAGTPPANGGGRGGGRGGGPRREFGATQSGGTTALLYAARDGAMEAVRALVESGADVNLSSGSEKISPMVMAISNGHLDIAKFLLDHGANPNAATVQGLTPLYATIDVQWSPHAWYPEPIVEQEQIGYLDLMKILIARSANVNAVLDRKPWFRTTSHDATWVDPAGATAFWRAAQATDVAAMKMLVAAGADPKLATTEGVTPLMVAAGLGWGWNFSVGAPGSWLTATRYCLELGLDVNTVDSKGQTALHGAAYVADNTLVQLLVDKGANVKAVAKDGNTVADMANGPNRFGIPHPETVALLEKLGSSNSHNCRSDTCLVAPTADKKPAPPR
jgi:ankyrin repeat protein